jgi:hypothetical protein
MDKWLQHAGLPAEQMQHLQSLLAQLKEQCSKLLVHTLRRHLQCWQLRAALQTYAGARGNQLFQQCFAFHFPDVPLPPLLLSLGKASGWFALAAELTRTGILTQPADLFDRLLTPMPATVMPATVMPAAEDTRLAQQQQQQEKPEEQEQQQQQQQQRCPSMSSFERLGPEIERLWTTIRAGAESVAAVAAAASAASAAQKESDHAERLLKELHYCLWNFQARHIKRKVKERYSLVTTSSPMAVVDLCEAATTSVASASSSTADDPVQHYFWNHSYRPEDARALSSADGWLTDECINIVGGFLWRQAVRTALLEQRLVASGSHILWLSSFFYTKLQLAAADCCDEQMQRFLVTAIEEQVHFQQRLEADMCLSPCPPACPTLQRCLSRCTSTTPTGCWQCIDHATAH